MNPAFGWRLCAHIVDGSGVAGVLEDGLRTDPRGRQRAGSVRTFLILGLLAADDGKITVERMHRIATRELPRDAQWELGILRRTPNGPQPLPIAELYHLTRTISHKLAWTGPDAARLDHGERQRRQTLVEDVCDRLICATHIARPGSSYALDESAIWAWAKGKRRPLIPQPRKPADDGADGSAAGAGAGRGHDVEDAVTLPVSACPDARWGHKTATYGDSRQEIYFGYALHALVRVPDLRAGGVATDDYDPILVEAIAVTPAGVDVVDVSLDLLDRVRARTPVRDLAADRHYSYKDASRWARQLWARGIHPVTDLRADEHGFRDFNSVRIAASWPHCPATPDRLAVLLRPGPTATLAEKKRFADGISERATYAMRRVKSHIPDGTTRWECPARAGKVGCSLICGTEQVARELQLPIIADPPSADEQEACCTQRTIQLRLPQIGVDDPVGQQDRHLAQAMKHAQDAYWGSPTWLASFNRRTHCEGVFGNLRNPDTHDVNRGQFRFTGLPLVTLAVALSVTVNNLRQLRGWHTRTGNGDFGHPLLRAEPLFHGYVLLDAAGARRIDTDLDASQLGLTAAA